MAIKISINLKLLVSIGMSLLISLPTCVASVNSLPPILSFILDKQPPEPLVIGSFSFKVGELSAHQATIIRSSGEQVVPKEGDILFEGDSLIVQASDAELSSVIIESTIEINDAAFGPEFILSVAASNCKILRFVVELIHGLEEEIYMSTGMSAPIMLDGMDCF